MFKKLRDLIDKKIKKADPALICLYQPDKMRSLKNVHFFSSSRKAKILTTGIH